MDPQKRFSVKASQTPPGHRSDQQRTDQPRGRGRRDGIELLVTDAALRHHLFNQMGQRLHMASGGDFRNDATPTGVLLHLRCNRAREHRLITHNGCG